MLTTDKSIVPNGGGTQVGAGGADPAAGNWKGVRAIVAEVLKSVPIVGPWLATALNNGAWIVLLFLLWAVWAFFVYPLLVPLLASVWINAGVLGVTRATYIEPVRQAFGAKEFADGVARESNRRLDYVQAIEYVADASIPNSTILSVEQNQKVIYQVEEAKLVSEDKKCQVPEELNGQNAKLFTLLMEDVAVGDIRNGLSGPHSLTPAQWKAIAEKGGEPGRVTITVQPVAPLSALRCGKVKIRMRMLFEVYKDLVGAPT